MNYKRLFIYDVACRSDSFMFLYSAADGLTRHARQVEWRGSAGAAGKRLRSGDTAIRPVWKTRTRANWNSRREQTQGRTDAIADNLVDAHSDPPCTRHGAVGVGGEEKPERRWKSSVWIEAAEGNGSADNLLQRIRNLVKFGP
jgi:hypothetical protein